MIFAPFSNLRVSWDLLFIIDPYLDLILIGGLILGWKGMSDQSLCYRLGGAALAGYMVMNTLVTGIALVHLDRWSAGEGLSVKRAAAIPLPFSPLVRRGALMTEDRGYDLTVTPTGVQGEIRSHPSALGDRRLDALWASRDGETYKWFARFPVITKDEGSEIVIQDLQFVIRDDGLGWLGKVAARVALDHNPEFFESTIFCLKVAVDDYGKIRSAVYQGGSIDGGHPYQIDLQGR